MPQGSFTVSLLLLCFFPPLGVHGRKCHGCTTGKKDGSKEGTIEALQGPISGDGCGQPGLAWSTRSRGCTGPMWHDHEQGSPSTAMMSVARSQMQKLESGRRIRSNERSKEAQLNEKGKGGEAADEGDPMNANGARKREGKEPSKMQGRLQIPPHPHDGEVPPGLGTNLLGVASAWIGEQGRPAWPSVHHL